MDDYNHNNCGHHCCQALSVCKRDGYFGTGGALPFCAILVSDLFCCIYSDSERPRTIVGTLDY